MIQSKKEEVMYWYNEILAQNKSGIRVGQYCESKGIPYKKFSNMKYRIMFSCNGNKKIYNEYVEHARNRHESGLRISEFCKRYNVDHRMLRYMQIHLRLKKIIDNYLSTQENTKMNFIQVPSRLRDIDPPSIEVESEVMKKQNNVELIISAGVKVVVAPEVGADKLIRIIELLKDL